MKYLLPVVGVLTLAICGVIRTGYREWTPPLASRGVVRTPEPSGHSSTIPEAELPEAGASSTFRHEATTPTKETSTQQRSRNDKRELAIHTLESLSPLSLSEHQVVRVRAVLEERAEELGRWHEEIRRSGVFDPQEYGRSLLQRRELWFRRIDALLDSQQHEAFLRLVAVQGVLRSGTDFTIHNDELVVIR